MHYQKDIIITPDVTSTNTNTTANTEHHQREQIRQQIRLQAGDVESLLGTVADTANILLSALTHLIQGLHQAKTLAEVRASAAPLVQELEPLLSELENNPITFPHQIKGLSQVCQDIKHRNQTISDIIQAGGQHD